MRHAAGERLNRHRHAANFATLVLRGSYVEAGDTGRHRVAAGDVITHQPFESHLDQFDSKGAEVLVIALPPDWSGPTLGRVEDPDLFMRLSEKGGTDLADALHEEMTPRTPSSEDWPDLLANDLIANQNLELAAWAHARKLHPGSVSRGFRQHFGVTPAGFRLSIRAGRAARAIMATNVPFVQIALACSFVDQAHMCNAVRTLTGSSPSHLRASARPANSGQR